MRTSVKSFGVYSCGGHYKLGLSRWSKNNLGKRPDTPTFMCTKQSQTEIFHSISAELVYLSFEWIHLFKKPPNVL